MPKIKVDVFWNFVALFKRKHKIRPLRLEESRPAGEFFRLFLKENQLFFENWAICRRRKIARLREKAEENKQIKQTNRKIFNFRQKCIAGQL